MKLLLKQNNADIRQAVEKAGINVCSCASFYGAEWLDYDTDVHGSVHGVGYTDGTDYDTPEEVREQFLKTSKDIHDCKDVDEFVRLIKLDEETRKTPEQFIRNCTRVCSNELCAVEDRYGKKVISYHEWLTPDQARSAVELAREEYSRHKDKLNFTAIPGLLEMIRPTERAKEYAAKLADALEREGYGFDARIVRNKFRMIEGEEVEMAVMDGKPVNKNYEKAAKEYRKFREECGVKDPVSLNEIEEAYYLGMERLKEQILKDAVEEEVFDGSMAEQVGEHPVIEYAICPDDNLKIGDKVKLIIIKEEK